MNKHYTTAAYSAAILSENGYVSPESSVVVILSEGVLCSSIDGTGHDDFTDDGSFNI